MKDEYPNSKSDLFAAFIERCTKFAGLQGVAAMITMQSWMFLSSYEKLRAVLLKNQRFTSMLHLGARAFDSIGGDVVSATAFVLENVPSDTHGIARTRTGVFIRLIDGTSEAEKVSALSLALEARTTDAGLHLASDSDFKAIPGSPIVYWLSEKMRAVFTRPAIASRYQAKAGPGTRDDQIFMRLHWEVERRKTGESKKWLLTDKAGEFRKWYAGCSYVMDWESDGYRIRNHANPDGSLKSRPQNTKYMFREGVTWGKVGSGETSFRWRPQGFGFNDAAPTIFGRDPFRLLGPLNSATATRVLSATGSTLNVQTGMIADLPFGDVETFEASQLASHLVSGSQLDWDSQETSWEFRENPLVALARQHRHQSAAPGEGH